MANTKDVKVEDSKKPSMIARKRVKLGKRNILTAPKKAGVVRRFVNDTGDRVQRFKEAGWNAVEDGQVGDPKAGQASSMGSSMSPSVGQGQRAVLMELPEEIYKADKAESQEEINKVERQMKQDTKVTGTSELGGKVSIS